MLYNVGHIHHPPWDIASSRRKSQSRGRPNALDADAKLSMSIVAVGFDNLAKHAEARLRSRVRLRRVLRGSSISNVAPRLGKLLRRNQAL